MRLGSVSNVTHCKLTTGVRYPEGMRNTFSPLCSDRLWGPPSPLSNGNRGVLPPLKRPGHEAGPLPPKRPISSDKNTWSKTSTRFYDGTTLPFPFSLSTIWNSIHITVAETDSVFSLFIFGRSLDRFQSQSLHGLHRLAVAPNKWM
jgi:hypothetical protein